MKIELNSELTDILKYQFNHDLLAITLFGSIVKGNFTSTSDIDVLVICENLIKDWQARDKDNFFIQLLNNFGKNLKSLHAVKIEKGVWNIPGLAVIESG